MIENSDQVHINKLEDKCSKQQDEITRLRTLVRDAYIEGHEDGGRCWSEHFNPSKGYAENDWHESDAKKAAEAAERSE